MAWLSHNARAIEARYRRKAGAFDLQFRNSAASGARLLTADSRQVLGARVYAIPAKRSPTGRPLWRRTGRLFAAERWEAVGFNIRHRNTAPHYLHRLRYGRPGGRPARPPQVAVNWPVIALARQARQIHRLNRIALQRTLSTR